MSKETSARIAKLASRVLNGLPVSQVNLRALAASVLAQREADLDWPTWNQLGWKKQNLITRRWHIGEMPYRDIRLTAIRRAKQLARAK